MKNNNLFPYKNLSLEDMQGEIWKDIQGYDGYYQVSNFGRIKSLSRYVFNGMGNYLKKEKIIKSILSNHGYLVVTLYIENVAKQFLVHRLVASAFVENLFNKEKVIHIDYVKKNNNSKNLEWASSLETICYQMNNQESLSSFIGVSFRKDRNKWISTIRINKKLIYLGSYETQEEAYQRRCDYEKNNNIENKYL
jgi:hypothetical protein